jgi:hypothetical protein
MARGFQCPALLGDRTFDASFDQPRRFGARPFLRVGLSNKKRQTLHLNWANGLKMDYKDPASPVSVPSWCARPSRLPGDGSGSTTDPLMAWNPRLKSYNGNRVTTKITNDALTANFRVLDYMPTPGAGFNEGVVQDPGRRAGTYRWFSLP